MSQGEPRSVSRFEASLLRILHYFFQQFPQEAALRLVNERMEGPNCLRGPAMELVRDSLAKGSILYLVRVGGWHRDRFLFEEEPRFGRVWERQPAGNRVLHFSSNVLGFLLWITRCRPREDRAVWQEDPARLTPADQLLFFLSYEALRSDGELALRLRGFDAFGRNPLIWLIYPGDFLSDDTVALPSWESWLSGTGSVILEAMQPRLEAAWLSMERMKGQTGDWAMLGRLGDFQGRILDTLLHAIHGAGRPDLARFLLSVLAKVLRGDEVALENWVGGLQGAGPPRLADRLAIQRQALAVPRTVERLRQWQQDARQIGYLDDGYAASRFWLAECDRYEFDAVATRAERLLRELEPL